MLVAIRADASAQIGIGHVMRCLTLAQALRLSGASVEFVCGEHIGHLQVSLEKAGFNVHLLPVSTDQPISVCETNLPPHASWLGREWQSDAVLTKASLKGKILDLLIVDHYGLDYRWEREMRSISKEILVIDDLADRLHDCDFLLDQTFKRSLDDYKTLIPHHCKALLGSDFVLLKPDFYRLRETSLNRRWEGELSRLLITMGGTDYNNATGAVLRAINQTTLLPHNIEIVIVLGSGAPHIESVKQQANGLKYNARVELDVEDMGGLMVDSDIAIGAAGTSAWERCCIGLPSILVKIAENQKNVISVLAQENAIVPLALDSLNSEFDRQLALLIETRDELITNSLKVCDGLGVARTLQYVQRCTDREGDNITLRTAGVDDIEQVHQWQSLPETRLYARNVNIPTLSDHTEWMLKRLASSDCYFYIIEKNNEPVGVVRLDRVEGRSYEISIFIAPSVFGLGVASHALSRLKSLHPYDDIIATVLQTNRASQKLFLKNGFQSVDNETYLFKGSL